MCLRITFARLAIPAGSNKTDASSAALTQGDEMNRRELYTVILVALVFVFGLASGILFGLDMGAPGGACMVLAIIAFFGVAAVSETP